MTDQDIRDPRVAPRWLEAGITGVPRSREWDVVLLVDIPELETSRLAEIAFDGLGGGAVTRDGEPGVPKAVLARLAAAVEQELDAPYEALVARRGQLDWALAARARRFEELVLPPLENVGMISVAVSPDGERSVYVLGEAGDELAVDQAVEELERRGRERHEAFVAQAEQMPTGWKLTIDPL